MSESIGEIKKGSIVVTNEIANYGLDNSLKKLGLKLYGPFLELPIIDLMYPFIKSIKDTKKNIAKIQKVQKVLKVQKVQKVQKSKSEMP